MYLPKVQKDELTMTNHTVLTLLACIVPVKSNIQSKRRDDQNGGMMIIMVEVSLYLLLCHSVALTQSKSLQFRATSPPVKIHIHTCEDLFQHSLPDLQSIHSILYPALENRGQNVLIFVTCKIFSPFTENQHDRTEIRIFAYF